MAKATAGRIPDDGSSVPRGGDNTGRVRAVDRIDDRISVSFEVQADGAGNRIPNDGGSVSRGGDDLRSVRAEFCPPTPAIMSFEAQADGAAYRIPDNGDSVLRSGDDMSPVRAEDCSHALRLPPEESGVAGMRRDGRIARPSLMSP